MKLRRLTPHLLVAAGIHMLVAVLIMSLLPHAAAGEERPFADLGCYVDAEGDGGHPDGDVKEFCINFAAGADIVRFVVDPFGTADPDTDAGWANDETMAQIAIAVDGGDEADFMVIMQQVDGALTIRSQAAGGGSDCEGNVPLSVGGQFAGDLSPDCFGNPETLSGVLTLTYLPEGGGATAMDRVPDSGRPTGLAGDPPESPVCANAAVDRVEGQTTIRRVACGIGGTEAVSQGVATSQFVFDDLSTAAIDPYQADWAVIARDDDFADALAGTSLTFGQGPLLFTYSPASTPEGDDPSQLADITRAELLRTLPRGRTVYVLGGPAALDDGLDATITDLGYDVVRFAGTGRENTARLVATEVRRRVQEFSAATGFPDINMVLIANGQNWPDAVVAGSVGAFWGMPILLTNQDSLHPESVAAMQEMDFDYAHLIGGQAVLASQVVFDSREHVNGREGVDLTMDPWQAFCPDANLDPAFGCRWFGSDRIGTAFAVGQLNRDLNRRFGTDHPLIPDQEFTYGVGVNLRRPDAFTFAMSAATVSGRLGGAVFLPAEGDSGDVLREDISNFMCQRVRDLDELLLIGDTDLLSDSFGQAVRDRINTINEPACADQATG